MATITIVGLGPGPLHLMTREAEHHLRAAAKVFMRTSAYPAHDWLRDLGKTLVCFDGLYRMKWAESADMYEFMATALLKEAANGGAVTYAVPGSPAVLEDTSLILQRRAAASGVTVRVIEGLSFIEPLLSAVGFDLARGLQIVLPWTHLEARRFSSELALLVCQIDARRHQNEPPRVDRTAEWLAAVYPADHDVTLLWASAPPEFAIEKMTVPLRDLTAAYGSGKLFASLFVPPRAT